MTTAVNLAALGNGPAFSAYQSSGQTVANATWTKVQFQTEEFDTNNCFDSVTNYRFTPTVAGYYQFNTSCRVGPNNATIRVSFYKNGSEFKTSAPPSGNYFFGVSLASLIYLNGTTDYVECYFYQSSGASGTMATGTDTWFNGALVRAA